VQDALVEGGKKAAIYEQDLYAKTDAERLEDIKKAGVKITKLDPAAFRQESEKIYAEFLTTDDEKKILKMIQDTK
jgi:TRAP-type C4-dicarboxylate transport system substrate-binding protein